MASDSPLNLRWLLIGGFPNAFLGGLALNLFLALGAFVISFVLGHGLAFGRMSRRPILRTLCTGYIELVRAIPLLMVLFWFYFALPIVLRTTVSPVLAGFGALCAYATAYQAEFIRTGVQSVARGQIDAAHSLGLSRRDTLLHVVLAQAHRSMVHTYVSYFTSLFKDSSALYILGLIEVMQAGLIIAERHPSKILEVYLTLGSLFFVICLTASWLGRRLERRFTVRRIDPIVPDSPLEPSHAHA
jgi:polar amino acid transport system permease protein